MLKLKKTHKKLSEFEQVALVHIDSVYNVALRMTRNTSDAEDLVQETYLKAFRFFGKFQTWTNCKAWLLKILTNLFNNKYRQRIKEPPQVSYDEIEEDFLYSRLLKETLEPNENPEQILFSQIVEDDVKKVMDNLPQEFRIVVILSFIEDCSYKEIAEIMDTNIGTVKSRLHRGRTMLQKALYEYAKKRGFVKE
ncbi:MAG TPA: sigma-70 family RNA polymerase sigma factor [candidate division Zixibacteria bacterium]|nr:sigma-70 family RNA polymerase sigma factor [candidate division Zixibacteria bacterium]